jgi:hypothetical protein
MTIKARTKKSNHKIKPSAKTNSANRIHVN